MCNLSPQYVAHRWDCLCGVLHTAKIVSAVCCTPPRLTQRWDAHGADFFETSRCATHCGDRLCCLLHPAEIDSAECNIKRRWSPWCAAHRGDNFVIEYLEEIETEFENTWACLSGAPGSNHEKKTGGRKSRNTPFEGAVLREFNSCKKLKHVF